MQGLLSSRNALESFCAFMIDIFSNASILDGFKSYLMDKPRSYTFTEMEAFKQFENYHKFNALDGCQPFNNMVFDQVWKHPQGFEMRFYNTATLDRLKRLFVDKNGMYFKDGANYVRTINLDCSWIPFYLFKDVLRLTKKLSSFSKPTEYLFKEGTFDRLKRFCIHYGTHYKSMVIKKHS
jgi:hypothetical protein